MEELGTIYDLRLSDVFVGGESGEFTPWLSENLDRLAAELGFELESDDTEVSVGKFKADITAKTTDGRFVVIENQFSNTDHSHLGQLLTYAAGLKADVIIWISERIREEHRAAIDWLNEKADDAEFYAVEARAVRIDESRPALVWDIVSSPNTYSRTTRLAEAGHSSAGDQLRIRYWAALNEAIEKAGVRLTKFKPSKQSWVGGTIGASEVYLNTFLSLRNRKIRVEIDLNGDRAHLWFETLYRRRDEIEKRLGYPLEWVRVEGIVTCRIYVSRDADPNNEDDWDAQHKWIIERRLDFERVFRPLVRKGIANAE